MQPSDWIAVMAIGATVLVAWFGHLDRSGDRANAEKLAREERQQERRATTYRDMLILILEVEDAIRTTLPVFDTMPPATPYPGPSTDAQRAMQAIVSAYGSPEVVDLYETAAKISREFRAAVNLVQAGELAATANVGSDQNILNRQVAEDNRTAFVEARKALERQARSELAK